MDRPTNWMTINCVMTLARPMTLPALHQLVRERLLPVARFRSIAVEERTLSGKRHRWREVEKIALEEHLLQLQLPSPHDDSVLQRLVSERMAVPLPPNKPLWRVHLIQGYRGSSALLWQLQHAMGDGVAMMVLLLSLTDLSAEADAPNPLRELFTGPELNPRTALRDIEAVMPEAARLMTKPADLLARTNPLVLWVGGIFSFLRLTLLPPDPRSVFTGRMGGVKRVAWSRSIPMSQIEELREALGGTVTDVLTTVACGALSRYWRDRGGTPRDLRAVIPVSLRPAEEMRDLGNRFGLVFLKLPLAAQDPQRRLHTLRQRMYRLKHSLQPLVTLVALGVLGRLPRWVQKLVLAIFGWKGSMVMSSVPGPRHRLYLAGHAIEDVFFWVPQSAGLNLGLSILTYAGAARVGLMTDAALVDDPQSIINGFHDELEALLPRKQAGYNRTDSPEPSEPMEPPPS